MHASITTTEGVSFSQSIASFGYSGNASALDFTAVVDWGDGQASPGSIQGGSGSFSVTGTHTYTEEGNYAISVLVSHQGKGKLLLPGGSATVASRPCSGSVW